jgi:hypothetical protein
MLGGVAVVAHTAKCSDNFAASKSDYLKGLLTPVRGRIL